MKKISYFFDLLLLSISCLVFSSTIVAFIVFMTISLRESKNKKEIIPLHFTNLDFILIGIIIIALTTAMVITARKIKIKF